MVDFAFSWSEFASASLANLWVDVGVTAFIAGWWSLRRFKTWLLSPAADPYVDRVAAKAAELVKSSLPPFPDVPSVDDFAERIRPDLVGMAEQGVSKQIDPIAERLMAKMSAFYASREASMDASLKRVESLIQTNPQLIATQGGGQLANIAYALRMLHKKREAETVMAISSVFEMMKRQQPGQQGYPGYQQLPPGVPAGGFQQPPPQYAAPPNGSAGLPPMPPMPEPGLLRSPAASPPVTEEPEGPETPDA